MGNYFLRKGTGTEATLFTRIRKRVPPIDKNVNTGIIVNREVWEKANRDASSLNKFYQTKDGQILYRKMVAIDNAINDLLRQGIYDDASIKEAVESVVYAEVRELQRKEEEDRLAMKLEMEESKRKNVLAFLRNFLRV